MTSLFAYLDEPLYYIPLIETKKEERIPSPPSTHEEENPTNQVANDDRSDEDGWFDHYIYLCIYSIVFF